MATASSGTANTDNHAQFWEDFWNTLYQFTHPFSSTFFDTVFSQDSATSHQEQQPPTDKPASTPSSSTRFFKDEASFQKFWQGLQNGTPDGSSESGSSGSLMDHLQTAWVDFKTASSGFIQAVEWQQTWIQMVLAMHLVIFIIIIALRNRPNPLAAMLFCTTALSEPLNGIGSRHWQSFSDDNYFDSHGVFTGLVWAAPLLVNAMVATMLLLRATVQLLVKVKRAQLQESKKKKQK
ncbi:Transmembrane protein 18 [Linnemannia exigua]|uniref:Transmembrane protein 18 n=1 Tax=Linnemannia exigua TaxID=604196 RepID=A0AAD4D542_9FUNG|nr:Transmembrane protein 18 [Linnemannia exigua]